METFECKCGKSFPDMDALTEHWKTNNIQTTGRAHYRDGIYSALREDSEWEPPMKPPMQDDPRP